MLRSLAARGAARPLPAACTFGCTRRFARRRYRQLRVRAPRSSPQAPKPLASDLLHTVTRSTSTRLHGPCNGTPIGSAHRASRRNRARCVSAHEARWAALHSRPPPRRVRAGPARKVSNTAAHIRLRAKPVAVSFGLLYSARNRLNHFNPSIEPSARD